MPRWCFGGPLYTCCAGIHPLRLMPGGFWSAARFRVGWSCCDTAEVQGRIMQSIAKINKCRDEEGKAVQRIRSGVALFYSCLDTHTRYETFLPVLLLLFVGLDGIYGKTTTPITFLLSSFLSCLCAPTPRHHHTTLSSLTTS